MAAETNYYKLDGLKKIEIYQSGIDFNISINRKKNHIPISL